MDKWGTGCLDVLIAGPNGLPWRRGGVEPGKCPTCLAHELRRQGDKMNLKIEDGILLKPHALARHDDGYSPPPKGWTPEDIADITALAQGIVAKADQVDAPTWQAAKLEAWLAVERQHYDDNKPWVGWVPVAPQTDRKIRRAYRNLFVEMNGGQYPPKRDEHAIFPPDGMYEYRNGRMSPKGE